MPTLKLDLEKNKNDIQKRISYALGHLKAVSVMIDNKSHCMEIINQNHAVIEALKKVNQLILEGHLGVCAWDAVYSKDTAKRKKAIEELISVYKKN